MTPDAATSTLPICRHIIWKAWTYNYFRNTYLWPSWLLSYSPGIVLSINKNIIDSGKVGKRSTSKCFSILSLFQKYSLVGKAKVSFESTSYIVSINSGGSLRNHGVIMAGLESQFEYFSLWNDENTIPP